MLKQFIFNTKVVINWHTVGIHWGTPCPHHYRAEQVQGLWRCPTCVSAQPSLHHLVTGTPVLLKLAAALGAPLIHGSAPSASLTAWG